MDHLETFRSTFARIYVRFFEFNEDLANINRAFDDKSDIPDFLELFEVRKHPSFGQCITYRHDKYKKYGLYYVRYE